MYKLYKNNKFKFFLAQFAVIALTFIGLSLLNSPKAHAAPDLCTSPNMWVTARVNVWVLDTAGNYIGNSSDFTFRVQTTDPSGYFSQPPGSNYWNQSIVHPGGAAAGADVTIRANGGHIYNCPSPSYPFTDGLNGNMYLNCLWGVDHAHSTGYRFTGISVNDYAGWTGTWSVQTANLSPYVQADGQWSDLNKTKSDVILVYRLTGPADSPPNIQVYPTCVVRPLWLPPAGAKVARIQTSDPNGGRLAILYKIWEVGTAVPGTWQTPSPASKLAGPGANVQWDIDMSGYIQSKSYNVMALTGGRGPGGSPPPASSLRIGQAVYGPCAANFTVIPLASLPSLAPDTEGPTTATFNNGYTISAPRSVTSSMSVTRTYYIKWFSGSPNTTIVDSPGLAAAPSRDVGTYNYPSSGPLALPPSLVAGDRVCQDITVNPGSGIMNILTGVVSGGTPVSLLNRCTRVVNKPYFKLNNGDISAGITVCSSGWPGPFPSGGILTSWSTASGGGAGTNLAAFALSAIDGFSSAQSPSGSSPPNELSFSNTAGDAIYGGSFGGDIACPTDYYATLPAVTTLLSGNFSVPDTNDAHMVNSAAAIITGGSITAGNRPIIYVDNVNVRISGDIMFVAAAASTISDIPSFYLVVRGGNIYIDPSVTRLDGVYITQPTGAVGGKIYTCSASGNNPPRSTPSDLNNDCKNQLIVNGAFIAKELKLYRSIGSLSLSPPVAAEIFNYTPATWLAAPASIGKRKLGGYDAITSLPPIL